MLSPEAELNALVDSLTRGADHEAQNMNRQQQRELVIHTLNVAHAVLHPNCRDMPWTLKLAVLTLERGDNRTGL